MTGLCSSVTVQSAPNDRPSLDNSIRVNFFFTTIVVTIFLVTSLMGYASDGFKHPGLLHGKEDIARMKKAVAKKQGPIYVGFKVLEQSANARADYKMKGPVEEWGRAPNINTGIAKSDAKAAYQNSLMWAITAKQAHADKAIEIVNAWARTLKKVSGIDGVLASGLQGFKFANAAEILRYTDSGWTEIEAKRCEKSFMEAWHPTIEHYAYFANGNWETAALQTNMAIAVFCNDRKLFEKTVRYAVNGAGNGSIPHMIVYPTGQCQETTRAQHYAQLGLGLLGDAAEVAWNQGVDLYGWGDNRILKGFEYTAKYGLGEEVPYQHYLDRTGKYGFGGRHNKYDKISTVSRGGFWPIFERSYHHYANRRGVPAPYSAKVAEKKRPENHSHDHVGLGTLVHWRSRLTQSKANQAPGIPAGLVARAVRQGIKLTWVKSVDPVSCTDAENYSIHRASKSGGPYQTIAETIATPGFFDTDVQHGDLYFYVVKAANKTGTSAASAELPASAALPVPWLSKDIGNVGISGFTEFNGINFTIEGEGKDINGKNDKFHFAFAPFNGEGTITARIIRPMSSQWTKPGVMMRESLDADSRHASLLLLPHWKGALVTRTETGGETTIHGERRLSDKHIIKKNRLSTPYWVRLIRFRDSFTGYMSPDGFHWKELGSVEIPMNRKFYLGLPACSQLEKVTTTVTYDNVSIPTWRMTNGDRVITARPEPRWHKSAWLERHNSINKRVKKGHVDLLMIGDSITHWWDKAGKKVWDQYYANRSAVNLAISGDRTEHVLWRLENGNIDGISPRLAVLMIGTNNHMSSPPEVTARDIQLIVKKLRTKLPQTKVLALGIFPRGAGDDDSARQINMKVNELVSSIGDGKMVHYLNINEAFLNGRRLRQNLIPDGTHPSEKGYAAWAEAMEPTLAKLLGEEPVIPSD